MKARGFLADYLNSGTVIETEYNAFEIKTQQTQLKPSIGQRIGNYVRNRFNYTFRTFHRPIPSVVFPVLFMAFTDPTFMPRVNTLMDRAFGISSKKEAADKLEKIIKAMTDEEFRQLAKKYPHIVDWYKKRKMDKKFDGNI